MRILFIANTFPSPDQKHVSPFNLRAAANLKAAGMNLQVVHLRSWKPGRPVMDSYEIEGISIIAVSLPFYAGLSPRWKALNILLYKKLFAAIIRKKINLKNIDLLHSVGAAHAGIVAAEISRIYKIPHIAQAIGSDVNILLPLMKTYPGVKGFEMHVNIFSANSESLAAQTRKIFPETATAVVYRGVNLNDFSPGPSARPADKIVFSFIGGYSVVSTEYGRNEKGAITLLKAWKRVQEKYTGDKKLCLRFGGPRVSLTETEEVLGDTPADLNIEIVGQLARQEVAGIFRSSHVVIIPSMFEGLPNAGMEAAACGAALIGSDTGGIPEIIERGDIGILVEPGNIDALAEAILQLAADPKLLNDFMDRCRPFITRNFDSAGFAPEYIRLYRKLTGINEN